MVCRITRNPSVANNGRSEDAREIELLDAGIALLQDELLNVTNILYVLIESARNDVERFSTTYKELGIALLETALTKVNNSSSQLEPRSCELFHHYCSQAEMG